MKTKKISLGDYVKSHVEICGGGKTDLMFFKMDKKGEPDKEKFLHLVKESYPHWLDGKEHSYLECGGDIGDQGIALTTMGLGAILKVWSLLTPANMVPFLPKGLQMEMAGRGMISIKKEVRV